MSAQHTPGPWAWFGNARNREVYLATNHSGRRYVMGFRRWGMRGAEPMFQPEERGLVPASNLYTFEVGDRGVRGVEQAKVDDSVYRYDISGIDCADARLIAAAPELLEALEGLLDGFPHPHTTSEFELVQAGLDPTEARKVAAAYAAIAKARGLP